jgi:hypothetical protein
MLRAASPHAAFKNSLSYLDRSGLYYYDETRKNHRAGRPAFSNKSISDP